jgi:methyl-accepting chemotaxis protein
MHCGFMNSSSSRAASAFVRQRTHGRSLARRVTAMGISMMALVLLLLSWVVSSISTHTAREQLQASVVHATEGLVASMDTVEQANQRMVERASAAFAKYFPGPAQWDAASATLSSNGRVLNANYAVVDQFSEDTGGVATVFARQGDDFVRITTSLRNFQGERVMHTQLDR